MILARYSAPPFFLVLCALVLVVDAMFFTVVTPLLPYYAERFEFSAAEVGLLGGAYPAGGAFAAIPAGIVVTRIGVKPSLLAGLAVMVATSAWFGMAGSGFELLLVRFVQGIGSTISWIAAFAWLLAHVPAEQRGEAIGLGYGISMVGSLLGPAIAPAVPELGPFISFGVIAVLFAALCLAFLPFPGLPPAPVRAGPGLRALASTPGIVLGFWLLTLQAIVFGGLSVVAPLRLADLGLTIAAIAIVYLATGGLAIGAGPLAGRWSDRSGRLRPMQYSLGGAIAGVIALPWLSRAWQFSLVLIAASLVLFLLSAPASAVVTDAVDAQELGYALGWAVILLGWGPGSMVGAVVAGLLTEATFDFVPYLLMSALCVATLAALSTRRARRTLQPILRDESSPIVS
jgi:ACDE family multidrug resistance protein